MRWYFILNEKGRFYPWLGHYVAKNSFCWRRRKMWGNDLNRKSQTQIRHHRKLLGNGQKLIKGINMWKNKKICSYSHLCEVKNSWLQHLPRICIHGKMSPSCTEKTEIPFQNQVGSDRDRVSLTQFHTTVTECWKDPLPY